MNERFHFDVVFNVIQSTFSGAMSLCPAYLRITLKGLQSHDLLISCPPSFNLTFHLEDKHPHISSYFLVFSSNFRNTTTTISIVKVKQVCKKQIFFPKSTNISDLFELFRTSFRYKFLEKKFSTSTHRSKTMLTLFRRPPFLLLSGFSLALSCYRC